MAEGADQQLNNARAAEQKQMQEQRRMEMEERRRIMIRTVLTPEAAERVNRIALVKPEKARKVEDMLLQMAQSGALGGRVDEPSLIQLLEKVSEGDVSSGPRVKIQRRPSFDDSD